MVGVLVRVRDTCTSTRTQCVISERALMNAERAGRGGGLGGHIYLSIYLSMHDERLGFSDLIFPSFVNLSDLI